MFGGEHKQTDIAQSAIFTTGSMRASRLYPTIFLTLLILLVLDFHLVHYLIPSYQMSILVILSVIAFGNEANCSSATSALPGLLS